MLLAKVPSLNKVLNEVGGGATPINAGSGGDGWP